MERIIETERLYLRKFMLKDASALFKMNSNKNVLKYCKGTPYKNTQIAEDFIKNYNDFELFNIGKFGVFGKKQGEFFGWCGLNYNLSNNNVEIDFRFSEKHWNNGYATEATKGVLTYSFNVLRVQTIYAVIDKRNKKAINVAIKTGFRFLKEIIKNKGSVNIYTLKNKLVTVKEITTEETLTIRQSVLRQGKPIESCAFDGDNNSTTFHLGLYYYGDLIGVATFIENKESCFDENNQYQLRGMAIQHQFQGKRFGNILLQEAIKILIARKTKILWCNARENATNFYIKSDFKIFSKPFTINSIGVHYKMYKKLQH